MIFFSVVISFLGSWFRLSHKLYANNIMFKFGSFSSVAPAFITIYHQRFTRWTVLNVNNNNFNTHLGIRISISLSYVSVFKMRLPDRLSVRCCTHSSSSVNTVNQSAITFNVYEHAHGHTVKCIASGEGMRMKYERNLKMMQRNLYVRDRNNNVNRYKEKQKRFAFALWKRASASPSVWYSIMNQYSFRPRRD